MPDMLSVMRAGGGGGANVAVNMNMLLEQSLREFRTAYDSESIHKWLSPPGPSTNHNTACATRHKGTGAWFVEGEIFQGWLKGWEASLLWIDGRPGSGKTVLCSTIIENIAAMRKARMAYFYFDFRNVNKQYLRDLIRSLLTQLSAHSRLRRGILARLYEDHDNGKTQPSDLALIHCLKQMLSSFRARRRIYIVLDALDECPDTSGIPSPRERVLQLVKDLVKLSLRNLCICVTSRPEVDIRNILEPLTPSRVSLHNESRQKQDILEYVEDIVKSDSLPLMSSWGSEDKDFVINTLSKRADGTFRWASCQLEVLRYCLPSSVRRTLEELPRSIGETYERILKEIKEPNRDHAHRIFQCLVVAVRPLKVEELAEVLAIDFDDSSGIAKLKQSWRCKYEEQALLSSCSSLITIVSSSDSRVVSSPGPRVVSSSNSRAVSSSDSRVVQFSHFSVKEFLTSPRSATSSGGVSRYHITLKHAHTILGQACLGVLLRLDDPLNNPTRNTSSLAGYAAQHWVIHAQFENVSSSLRKPMENLFDLDEPYFAVWLTLHDVDVRPGPSSTFFTFCPDDKSNASPLYYAALCGFHDLVEHLIVRYPKLVNAHGGYYVTPLVAALAEEHFRVAELLLLKGARTTVDIPGDAERIPLHSTAYYGQVDVVRLLLKHNADAKSQDDLGWTALHYPGAIWDYRKGPNVPQKLENVARLLLKHGADVNARNHTGDTPLHVAARCGNVTIARVLLEHGANVDEKDNEGKTPFQHALEWKQNEIIGFLSEHGPKSSRG